MVDASNADSLFSVIPGSVDDLPSIWEDRFTITSFASDAVRWNRDWEKALYKLPSKDVYSRMCILWKPLTGRQNPADILSKAQDLRDELAELQGRVLDMWNRIETRRVEKFRIAWLLLDDEDRRRHLTNGVVGASRHAAWGQNARALCPEITASSMLKAKGRSFIDFVFDYHKCLKSTRPGTLYLLPSNWWAKALGEVPTPSDEDKLAFELLTLQREQFICLFIQYTTVSVADDIVDGSAGMDNAKAIMSRDPFWARAWDKTVSELRVKPIIRCENCTKSPEEIGGNTVFMVCGACKNKLNFIVHYCSQECQKQDWRKHKKHCGKEKIAKKLPGTAHDPLWAFGDIPDYCRSAKREHDGTVSWASIGFATPHPSRQVSPALQRQITLYSSAREVDYFLFDESDHPVPFVLFEMWAKMTFRNCRAEAISSADQEGVEAMAEYLIRVMGQRPGLSRELILTQFEREYGEGTAAKVQAFEEMTVKNGYSSTFIEVTSRNMAASASNLMKF